MGNVVIIPHRLVVQIVADKDGQPVLQGLAIEAAKWEIDGVNEPIPLALAPISDATVSELAELLGQVNLDAARRLADAEAALTSEQQLRLEAEQAADISAAAASETKASLDAAVALQGTFDQALRESRAELLKAQHDADRLRTRIAELEELLEGATRPAEPDPAPADAP